MKCSACPPRVVRLRAVAGSHARAARVPMQAMNAARRTAGSSLSITSRYTVVAAWPSANAAAAKGSNDQAVTQVQAVAVNRKRVCGGQAPCRASPLSQDFAGRIGANARGSRWFSLVASGKCGAIRKSGVIRSGDVVVRSDRRFFSDRHHAAETARSERADRDHSDAGAVGKKQRRPRRRLRRNRELAAKPGATIRPAGISWTDCAR